MKQLRSIENVGPVYIGLGSFDGIHRGHLALAKQLAESARQAGAASMIVSLYDPEATVLTTEEEKSYLLQDSGVDYLLSLPYTEELRQLSRKELLQQVLIPGLGVVAIVCGEDDLPGLKDCGLTAISCPMQKSSSGQTISSCELKRLLAAGDLAAYQEQAGHAYLLIGIIVHGAARGRKVGQPTANLGLIPQKQIPPHGVYATLSGLGEDLHMGLTNIGRRPSVDDRPDVTVETFILDFDEDIYGETEVLELCFPIRGVMKFNGLEEVRDQVQKDIQMARAKLSAIYTERLR